MQHNSPGCLWKSFEIPNHSLQLYLLPGIGSELWGISKGSHVCWYVAVHAGYQIPWCQLLPLNYSKTVCHCFWVVLFRFGLVLVLFVCLFFLNKHAECNMLAAINIQIKYHCVMCWLGIKRNRRWHWVLLKLVIYCLAPLQVWWQRADSRQVCLPWLKGLTAGF